MATTDLLEPYLSDHRAGAIFGTDLAQKLASDTEGTPFGLFMAGLAADVDEDRQTLENIIEALEIDQHPLKKAGGWMAEKLSRVRLASGATGSGKLSRLMEMETLSMGILGKLCLWQALGELSRIDPEPVLSAFDFDVLAERAQDQLDRLEPHRRASAGRAFDEAGTG